ncbi:pickpocket protein 11 [Drosophila grimshawi]|nr:pickpocket protein 11 [Drosophila grimshawi]
MTLGTCSSFNSIYAENPDPTWPWSVADYGIKSALNIQLNRYLNGIRLQAIGVIVQEPSELIGSSVTYTSDDRIVLTLQPLHFTAEPGVRSRPVNIRHCYFPEELTESYSDCTSHCHFNYILEKCNCTYDLPKPVKVDLRREESTRRCEVKDLPCLQANGVSLFYMGNIIEQSKDNIFNTTDCECFPSCTHTQYHAVTFTDKWNSLEGNENYIKVDVHFQEATLFSYRSTLYITILDLMVSYGGIAGLFLGISVLGAVNAILNRISCCKKHVPEPESKPVKPDHAP